MLPKRAPFAVTRAGALAGWKEAYWTVTFVGGLGTGPLRGESASTKSSIFCTVAWVKPLFAQPRR